MARSAAAVLRSVRDGERLILARHGEPVGIVLSVRDAIEAMIEPDLLGMGSCLEEECLRRAEHPEVWRRTGPGMLAFSADAEQLAHLVPPRDRMYLQLRMNALVAEGLRRTPTLVWGRTGRWIAAFSQPAADLTLIWELIDADAAYRALVGEEVRDQLRARDNERMLHARGLPPRRLQGQR